MLAFTYRPRLSVDKRFRPLDEEILDQPLRATEWEFALEWSDGDIPNALQVDGQLIRHSPAERQTEGRWAFVLPPTACNLTRLEARSRTSSKIVLVLKVIPEYQLPKVYLDLFLSWMGHYKQYHDDIGGGEIELLSVVDSEVTLSSEDSSDALERDLPSSQREEITRLIDQVFSSPSHRLVGKKQLVPPGKLRRVSVSTVEFFVQHPETWHLRGQLLPRPIRLLDERYVEDFDVYENRFVLFFLHWLADISDQLVHKYRNAADESERQLKSAFILVSRRLNGAGVTERLQRQKEQVDTQLEELRRFNATIRNALNAPLFSTVRQLEGSPRSNTKLRLHPVYGRLFRVYEKIANGQFVSKRMQTLSEVNATSFQTIYHFYCFLLLIRALHERPFSPADATALPVFALDDPLPSTASLGKGFAFHFKHQHYPELKIKLIWLDSDEGPIAAPVIRLTLLKSGGDDKLAKVSTVWICTDACWWGDSSIHVADKRKRLEQLYRELASIYEHLEPTHGNKKKPRRKKTREEQPAEENHSVVLFHPTPPEDFDARLGYRELRLLLNQGDNFVSDAAYGAFGGYKVAFLPIYPGAGDSEMSSLQRLRRMLRINLFRLGFDDMCWNCLERGTLQQRAPVRRFTCGTSSCQLRWGEVQCQQCDRRYYKMRKKGIAPVSLDTDDIDSARAAIVISEAIEGKLAVSSVCENLDRLDDFWAICPYCGDCEKESSQGQCMRCQTRATLMQ